MNADHGITLIERVQAAQQREMDEMRKSIAKLRTRIEELDEHWKEREEKILARIEGNAVQAQERTELLHNKLTDMELHMTRELHKRLLPIQTEMVRIGTVLNPRTQVMHLAISLMTLAGLALWWYLHKGGGK